ncbi:hypothetical protein [Acidisphaera sp. S103]|uniref:hypothetical protein n=1 Tax=Acidisphaera sp. S103 TaxID=1747223 RepID=UPI00131EA89F|nr:hypothetical protein [Acidisphaera sp. S103]
MTITITSSTSQYILTASNTSAYVVPGATIITGVGENGIYVGGNYDVLTNAGTIRGELGVIFGGTTLHGEGDTFVNLASGYVNSIPAEPGTTILFNSYSGTVINSGRIGAIGNAGAIALEHGGSVTNTSTGTIAASAIFVNNYAGTVLNQGLIEGGGTTNYGAILLAAGGSVTNLGGGTIVSTGFYGVEITQNGSYAVAGTVNNAGVIDSGTGPAVTFASSIHSDLVIDQTTACSSATWSGAAPTARSNSRPALVKPR